MEVIASIRGTGAAEVWLDHLMVGGRITNLSRQRNSAVKGETAYALLQEQYRGECRLRLILREAIDLKRGPKADPLWFWDYAAGSPAITCVAETWTQTK